jgi:hypothetical protein
MGIEPTSEAWGALNKTLKAIELAALTFPSDGLKLETRRKLKAATDCSNGILSGRNLRHA